jgi:hypothetical protein
LILDAFTSDAIPVHLLTVEAFRLYEKALVDDGILAVHVSNRHFDLIPLVARVGFEVGLEPLVISTTVAARFQSQLSDWVFLSPSAKRLRELAEFFRERTERQRLPPSHADLQFPEIRELQHIRL